MGAAAVTGLAAEARIARRAGLPALAAGGAETETAAAVARLIADGGTALVSFGICGGLDAALASGAVVLPRAVRDEAGAQYAVDRSWHERLGEHLRRAGFAAATGTMLGASRIVATPSEKLRLFHDSGAIAVDLESHVAGRLAAAACLPFLVLRTVADPATRTLPPAALIGLDAQGRVAWRPALRSLADQPAQIPALLQTALDTRRALAALRHATACAGEALRAMAAP